LEAAFKDKVIWITGASSGIGEALAELLFKQGARLVLSSNEPDELERVRKKLNATDERILIKPLDLGDSESMTQHTDEVIGYFSGIDILINNGGISQRAEAVDTDLAIDRKVMEIDYFGQIALTKAVLPLMMKKRAGHIVVTTSVMGLYTAPLRSAYCAAKHALHGFFDTLRTEVWRNNIHVTLVCPAAVLTSISKNALTGNGGRFGLTDKLVAAGIPPADCAKQIMKGMLRKREEIIVGKGLPILAVYVKRFLPRVFSSIMKRVDVT